MELQSLHDWLVSLKLGAIGLLGAGLASRAHRSELLTTVDWFVFLATGWACATFLSGLAVAQLGIAPEHTGAVGFLLGLFGGSLIAAVYRAIAAADLWGMVKARFGGKE